MTGVMDTRGVLHIIEVTRFRGDTLQLVSAILDSAQRHNPRLVGIERGHIQLAIESVLKYGQAAPLPVRPYLLIGRDLGIVARGTTMRRSL